MVDTERVVAVVDGGRNKHVGDLFAGDVIVKEDGSPIEEKRTALIMDDGKCVLTKLRKEAVIKRLKDGRLNGTGVNKIGS